MKYETLESYSAEEFRRITGVRRVTFEKMLEILCRYFALKHVQGGL